MLRHGVGQVPDAKPDRAVRHRGDSRGQRRALLGAAGAPGRAHAAAHAEMESGSVTRLSCVFFGGGGGGGSVFSGATRRVPCSCWLLLFGRWSLSVEKRGFNKHVYGCSCSASLVPDVLVHACVIRLYTAITC